MGVSFNRAQRAVKATGGDSVERAVEWCGAALRVLATHSRTLRLFSQPDNPALDEPLEQATSSIDILPPAMEDKLV